MNNVYNAPRYYDIAFDFRDLEAEANVLAECIERYSRIPVRAMLEIGCGHAPHLEELARRGYAYVGLDLSAEMLAYAAARARQAGIDAQWIRADMTDFALEKPVDFAFVMLGSLYLAGAAQQGAHFDAVARALRPGGLYFLDWCVVYPPTPMICAAATCWQSEIDDVCIDVQIAWEPINQVEQTFRERVVLDVDDAGTHVRLENTAIRKAIFPQEFLQFIAARDDFEFVGWWNDWDLDQPLDQARDVDRPIALLRRL